jgi:hypothetical protein
MVDDINFPRGLPPVPASGRIQRVNRKKGEEKRQSFENFFDEEDQKDEKEKKRKKKLDKLDIPAKTNERHAQNLIESSSSTDAAEAQNDSEKKVIDVRV